MKRFLTTVFPWIITVAAIYYVCRDLDWQDLLEHAATGDLRLLGVAVLLTAVSYLLRSYRWLFLFPDHVLSLSQSIRVLFLGFFMNNILPARTGEFVRAHMGAKFSGQKRTLVLATIASERLTDGLTISLMFLVFCIGLGGERVSNGLLYVSYLFLSATAVLILLLILRTKVFQVAENLGGKFNNKYIDYAISRLKIFINGLSPLLTLKKLPFIVVLSAAIWCVELLVYVAVCNAFNNPLPLAQSVLFMVTVNFSSLIPSAPGAIGVIEAVTTAVLVSIGIPKELALSMVLSQHLIQYIVVAIPGLFTMLTWKASLKQLEQESENDGTSAARQNT